MPGELTEHPGRRLGFCNGHDCFVVEELDEEHLFLLIGPDETGSRVFDAYRVVLTLAEARRLGAALMGPDPRTEGENDAGG